MFWLRVQQLYVAPTEVLVLFVPSLIPRLSFIVFSFCWLRNGGHHARAGSMVNESLGQAFGAIEGS